MHLQADPSLAEVAGFSPEQLASLARSIELKKQKLESDIYDYITTKQSELHACEQELLAQYRESLRGQTRPSASMCAESQNQAVPPHSANAPAERPDSPEEKKRTKHTRVHKREKELFGLVTPIFLPLLEAGDPTSAKKKEKKRRHKETAESSDTLHPTSEQPSSSRDASKAKEPGSQPSEGGEKVEQSDMMQLDMTNEKQASESRRKPKRPAMKKSSLRKNSSGERGRRKRVSLVIDDQIVLPADEYHEPPLTSPSETTISSNSTSTTSLDDLIDPRLLPNNDAELQNQVEYHEHHDAEHHSLPHQTYTQNTSPTKQTGPFFTDSPPTRSPPQSPTPTTLYDPPKSESRSFLDMTPSSTSIPIHASASPIYASQPERAEQAEESFSTYVGGPSGSGVDDVDQTGSLGYPSSLGASYMESYMQSRPLSVRMAAAEKAGLDDDEKELLMSANTRGRAPESSSHGARATTNSHAHVQDDHRRDDDEMDVIGSMEDF